jgi:hypothetical protein
MLVEAFPMTSPIVFLAEMTIAPRLILQVVRLVGVYRGSSIGGIHHGAPSLRRVRGVAARP